MTRTSQNPELSDEEKAELYGLLQDELNNKKLAQRAEIIILASNGLSNKEIGNKLGVSEKMVSKWRNRFIDHRVKGLQDSPGRGRDTVYNEEDIITLIQVIFEQQGIDSWSIRTLQRALKENHDIKVSTATLQRILAKLGLKLEDSENWLETRENEFSVKTMQITGINIGFPFNAMVLSVGSDTIAAEELHSRTLSKSLLAELILNDKQASLQPSREFIEFLKTGIMDHPHKQFCVIIDDSSLGKNDLFKKWLASYPDRVNVISASSTELWLSQIQLMLTILAQNVMENSIFDSKEKVVSQLMAYIKQYEDDKRFFCWTDEC